MYLSDNVRLAYIKKAVETADLSVKPSDFTQERDFIVIKKKGNILHYYEKWLESCWQALYKKPQYKGLSRTQAIDLYMRERFGEIARLSGYRILRHSYLHGILFVEMEHGKTMNNKTVYIAGLPEAVKDNRERVETIENLLREAGYGTTGRPQKEPWKMTREEFRQTAKPLNQREYFLKAWLKDNEDIPNKVSPGINHIFVKNGELLVYGNERGSAVGVVSIYKNEIHHIAVLDKYQNKGIAMQLVRESRKYGVQGISGNVSPEFVGIAHKFLVETAFIEGKPVAQTVLKEYPDLIAKAEKQKWRNR